jgi:hypothetical protein
VLDFLCRQDAEPFPRSVDAVAGVRDVAEGALVMFCLET